VPPAAYRRHAASGEDSGRMSDRLRVDPIGCAGHGLCAEIFPEWIALDDWGYPMIEDAPIPGDLLAHARRAAPRPPLRPRVSVNGSSSVAQCRSSAQSSGPRPARSRSSLRPTA
jgi:ferredoxin